MCSAVFVCYLAALRESNSTDFYKKKTTRFRCSDLDPDPLNFLTEFLFEFANWTLTYL